MELVSWLVIKSANQSGHAKISLAATTQCRLQLCSIMEPKKQVTRSLLHHGWLDPLYLSS